MGWFGQVDTLASDVMPWYNQVTYIKNWISLYLETAACLVGPSIFDVCGAMPWPLLCVRFLDRSNNERISSSPSCKHS